MKTYELLAVFKPNLDAEEVDKQITALNGIIKDFEGTVESTDKMNLSIPADKVAEFKRQLRLNDNILRTMFMEVPKAHAVN